MQQSKSGSWNMVPVKDLNPDCITDSKGHKRAVVLSSYLKEYEELLEYLNDLAIAAERGDESVIAHQKVMEELKRDGCLL